MTIRLREIARRLPEGLTRDDFRGIREIYQKLSRKALKPKKRRDAGHYLGAWEAYEMYGRVVEGFADETIIGALLAGHAVWSGHLPKTWNLGKLRTQVQETREREGVENTLRAVTMMYRKGTPLSWVEQKNPEFILSATNWERFIQPALTLRKKARGQPESTHTEQALHGVKCAR